MQLNISNIIEMLMQLFVNAMIFLAFLLPTGCEAAHERANMVELRHIVVNNESIWKGKNYIDNLPLEEKVEVARIAAADANQNISIIGIHVLVESGLLDEAVPALANRVLEGDDLTAFGYAWTHSDDPQLTVRMYLKISRYLLAKFDSFDAGQKKKTERFIVSNLGRANYLKKFSVEATEQRLSQMEARLLQSEKQK